MLALFQSIERVGSINSIEIPKSVVARHDHEGYAVLQNQQANTRAGLVASKDVIEKEMESCHENIMALHADLDAAGKQNDEARQDASAARFAAIKYAPLCCLFLASE